MARIRLIFERYDKKLEKALRAEFTQELKTHYPNDIIEADFDDAEGSRSAPDLEDEAHDTAAQAEYHQRESGADLVAYLRPIVRTIGPKDTDEEYPIRFVMIAVAHERGIGSFDSALIQAISHIPHRAVFELMRVINDLNDLMRPRKHDVLNEAASALGSRLKGIIEDMAHRAVNPQ